MTYFKGHVHFKGTGSKIQSPKVSVQSCLAHFAHFPALGTSCISLCIHGSDCRFLFSSVSPSIIEKPNDN